MAGVEFNYTIKDTSPSIQEALKKIENFNARAMFDDVGEYMVSTTVDRFARAQDKDGNDWIPSQSAINEGRNTLTKGGHLRDSYTYLTYIDGTGVVHGSGMEKYAAIHEFGGDAGINHSVHLPARPVLGLNSNNEDDIDAICERFIREALQ